jgi:hypothetical protein
MLAAGLELWEPSCFCCQGGSSLSCAWSRAHAHENEPCRGERPLARVRFSITISGRPAGRPYDIAIFETVYPKTDWHYIKGRIESENQSLISRRWIVFFSDFFDAFATTVLAHLNLWR